MPRKSKVGDLEVQMDRRRNPERRSIESDVKSPSASAKKARPAKSSAQPSKAASPIAAAVTEKPASQLTARKQQRRRQIDPTTCEREYNLREIQFMQAIDAYKRSSGRMFPTCSEILEVIDQLGYVQLTEDERSVLRSIEEVQAEIDQLDASLDTKEAVCLN
jgi:hypothetical protein